jgi:hypothetical protein
MACSSFRAEWRRQKERRDSGAVPLASAGSGTDKQPMTDPMRIRLAGLACLAAALLRAVGAFASGYLNETPLQGLYIATDLALTLGITGYYARYRHGLGWIGLAGYGLVIAAILFIRTTAYDPKMYFFGAVAFSLGLAVIGGAALAGRRAPRTAPGLWLASTAVGALALAFPHASWPFLAASLIFCAGFAAAGVGMLRAPQGET